MTQINEFVELAKTSGWSRSKTRDQLYRLNEPQLWAERDAILTALGFAATNQTAPAATAQESHPTAVAAEALPEIPAVAAVQPLAQHDELTIWVDAGENKRRVVVNGYGKKVKRDYGGFVAGVVIEETGEQLTFTNQKASYSLEAEAFAIIKAIDCAVQRGAKRVTIRSDAFGSIDGEFSRRANKVDVYFGVARKIIAEHGIECRIERIENAANIADDFLRRWADLPTKSASGRR